MSILEQAFKNEVEDNLAARGIVINDDRIINAIVDTLVNDEEDMWDYITSTILRVSGEKIAKYLEESM